MHLFFCDRTFALAPAHPRLFVSVQGLFGPGYVELLYGVTDSIVDESAIACTFAVNEYRVYPRNFSLELARWHWQSARDVVASSCLSSLIVAPCRAAEVAVADE